jgi:transcriptional regulator GlxA family with amidase domain
MKTTTEGAPTHIGFILLSQYSMIAFVNAVEVLRMANRVSDRTLYRWSVCHAKADTAASNGLALQANASLRDLDGCEMVFVCGGLDVEAATTPPIREDLRRRAARGQALGGLCTGAYVLASAGVLDGYRCAIHWQNMVTLREAFPTVQFGQDIYQLDRDRCTASGGIAPLHMMVHLVMLRHGRRLAMAICEHFVLDRVRSSDERQRMPQPECIGPGYQHLADACEIMASNIEDPMPLTELASALRISLRQLERLFRRYKDTAPAQYYLSLRLHQARELVRHTSLPVTQVALACGFQSSSHFCRAYRTQFGFAPRQTRKHELPVYAPDLPVGRGSADAASPVLGKAPAVPVDPLRRSVFHQR